MLLFSTTNFEFPPPLHWNSNRKTKMDKRKSRMKIKNRSQKQKISSRNAFHIKIKLVRFLSIICMLSNACIFLHHNKTLSKSCYLFIYQYSQFLQRYNSFRKVLVISLLIKTLSFTCVIQKKCFLKHKLHVDFFLFI